MKYRKSPLQIEKHHFIHKIKSQGTLSPALAKSAFPPDAIINLEKNTTGRIVWPSSKDYNQARREFDDLYPALPQVIIYAANYQDVRTALSFAHEFSLQTAIRSGGHSFSCYSVCDGMVIDVSQLNNIHVNAADKMAVIETGCNFEKIYPAVELYGLHIPGGGCPTVCIGGYMQGGGYSLTSRMYGMNCDNVLECTVMLADGRIVVANAQKNEDLFWAIRGGTGGNFGVLLSAKYHLHSLGDIYGIRISWPIADDLSSAAQVLCTVQETYMQPNAFPNMGIEIVLASDSDDSNRKKIFFCATWIGEEDTFMQALQPLVSVGKPAYKPVQKGPYSKINFALLEDVPNVPPDVMGYARSAIIARALQQVEWEKILQFFLSAPNQFTTIDMECYGGKINDIPAHANAFIHRNAQLDFFCLSLFNKATNDQQQCEDWMEAYYRFLAAFSNGHSYQNYPDRKQDDFRWAYWGNYYNQLVAVKNKYDPCNFFYYQQSIGPDMLNCQGQIMLFGKKDIVYETY